MYQEKFKYLSAGLYLRYNDLESTTLRLNRRCVVENLTTVFVVVEIHF